MKFSIRKRIGLVIACVLALYVLISFVLVILCINKTGSQYRYAIAESSLDFAESVINADAAKEVFVTRNTNEEFESVRRKLKDYQKGNSDVIDNISMVVFNSTGGSFIYDTGDQSLGSRFEYDEYTESVKAELINGRNTIEHTENGKLSVYRPIRTVDDNLAGHIIVRLKTPFEMQYVRIITGIFIGLLVLSGVIVLIIVLYLNNRVFRPIKQITDSTVYLAGDDSASEGRDAASVIFDTNRNDEIGQLSKTLQKILFDMSSGAEHLSQALYDANHDGMTQLLNKRCYHSMEETFHKCNSICIIYFDVNNLKLMNDTHSHESGDFVIKRAKEGVSINGSVSNADTITVPAYSIVLIADDLFRTYGVSSIELSNQGDMAMISFSSDKTVRSSDTLRLHAIFEEYDISNDYTFGRNSRYNPYLRFRHCLRSYGDAEISDKEKFSIVLKIKEKKEKVE